MKKIFAVLVPFALVATSVSCRKPVDKPKKTEPVNIPISKGIPYAPDSLHGYLYVGYKFSPKWNQNSFVAIALFGDPARPLAQNFNTDFEQLTFNSLQVANVSVNELSINGIHLKFQPSGIAFYELRTTLFNIEQTATWKAAGNGSFLKFEVTTEAGFPSILDSTLVTTIPSNQPFTVDLDNYFSNYDSAAVTLGTPGFGSSGFSRRTTAKNPVIHFSPGELASLKNQSFNTQLMLMAYNYSHMTINNKRHLFVTSVKLNESVSINP